MSLTTQEFLRQVDRYRAQVAADTDALHQAQRDLAFAEKRLEASRKSHSTACRGLFQSKKLDAPRLCGSAPTSAGGHTGMGGDVRVGMSPLHDLVPPAAQR